MTRNTNYTIKEIAEIAGVSRATVDRVIHGRGVVSPKTAQKIKNILEKIDFRPNLLAQSLKKGELLKIAILVPDPKHDIYWKRAVAGIDEAISEYAFIGIHIDKFLFNPYKPQSFTVNSRHVLKGDYNGVILAPFFYKESLEFFQACDQLDLPYVTFNTSISESNPVCFVGQDLIESGRTAASLMDKVCERDQDILVLHLDEDLANAKHMQKKAGGFIDYFHNQKSTARKVSVHKIDSISQIDLQLGAIFEQNNSIGGIFVSTSKVHFVADFIKEYKLSVKLIGYDLISDNVAYLKMGVIDYLLFQNPKLQAKQALTALIDFLAFRKEVPKRQIIPSGIVIKENLESYLYGL